MRRLPPLLSLPALLLATLLAGCTSWPMPPPKTPGDPQLAPSYGYHPIDPLPVRL